MRLTACAVAVASLMLVSSGASAQDEVERARDEFRKGAELAKDAQWGAALAAFERSAKLRPHPWTTFNLGICERALGQYVRAKKTFARALAERRPDADLPEATVGDAQRFMAEIERLVGALDVTIEPADAALTIDGQALEHAGKEIHVELDPGAHVFLLTREGFSTAAHGETVRPGEKRAVHLAIARLPATIIVSADQPQAVVAIDRLDVGVAPVTVQRGAGTHHVLVRKLGFLAYETEATVKPGQRIDLAAALQPERPSILSRWWFWTALGAVVSGAAITTYALTRPEPQRPPLDGGGLGWSVRAP
jgi:hypothetical protein